MLFFLFMPFRGFPTGRVQYELVLDHVPQIVQNSHISLKWLLLSSLLQITDIKNQHFVINS